MAVKTKYHENGAAMATFPNGLWFQAGCSGLWYENRHAAGTVSNIMLDGELFKGPERPDICEHGIPEGDWCEPCNRAYKEAAADQENGNT